MKFILPEIQKGFRDALAGAASELPSGSKTHDYQSLGQQLRDELAKTAFNVGVSPAKDNPLSRKEPLQAAVALQQTTAARSRSPAL